MGRKAKKASVLPQTLDSKIAEWESKATRKSTKTIYNSALSCFSRAGNKLPASPETVADYLEKGKQWMRVGRGYEQSNRKLSVSGCRIAVAALGHWHRQNGHPDPTKSDIVRAALRAITRERKQPKNRARPITLAEVHRLVDYARANMQLAEARFAEALVLTLFYGGFRISEGCGIKLDWLTFRPEGALVLLPRSKTDDGDGAHQPIPRIGGEYCPCAALEQHIGKRTGGYLFRRFTRRKSDERGKTANSIAFHPSPITTGWADRYLKKLLADAGIDLEGFKMHSWRRGSATELGAAGVDLGEIAKHLRHKDVNSSSQYVQENPARRLATTPMRQLATTPPPARGTTLFQRLGGWLGWVAGKRKSQNG